jgi:hypothetical protein
MHRICPPSIVVVAALLLTAPVLAQTGSGRVILGEGSSDWLEGTYGGETPAQAIADGCPGHVNSVPDFILEVPTDGWVRVTVNAVDGGDTTLLVRGPAGTVCNDDAGEGTTNSEILTFLTGGEYYVHVGAHSAGRTGPFEIRFARSHGGRAPELNGDRGFRLVGNSGGRVNAADQQPDCVGAIAENPNHTFRLTRPMYMEIEAVSLSDLTLLVVGDSNTVCNDDARGTLNPKVTAWFSEGLLQIYVGSHNPRVEATYELTVTPIAVD